jgi:exopolysaccharide biosynthesis polyprenyl glycosylphosphotransferase
MVVSRVLAADAVTPLIYGVPSPAVAPLEQRTAAARTWPLRLVLTSVDVAAITAAWSFALAGPFSASDHSRSTLLMVAATVLTALVVLRFFGLYQSRVSSARSLEIAQLGKVSMLAGAPVLFIESGAHQIHLSELGVGVLVGFVALVVFRSVIDSWFRHNRRLGRHIRPEIVIGTDDEAERLCQLFIDHPDLGHRIVGVVGDHPIVPLCGGAVPWLGTLADASRAAALSGATGAFVVSGGIESIARRHVIDALRTSGLRVHLTTGVYGVASHRVKSAPIAHEAMLYLQDWTPSQFQRIAKRTVDLVVSSMLLVVASPVVLMCALAVKFTSPGPVFFRQQRVGLRGGTFKLYKLRTMVVDAEQRKAALVGGNQRNGPLFKLGGDPRITRVGKFLRMSSLDELPQLLNVLKGEMSLVGPRPALPEEVAQFDDALLERHLVKPGITGLWQVEARENPAFGPYRRLDLFYAQNWSVSLDLVILILTAQVVATRVLLGVFKAVGFGSPDAGVLD